MVQEVGGCYTKTKITGQNADLARNEVNIVKKEDLWGEKNKNLIFDKKRKLVFVFDFFTIFQKNTMMYLRRFKFTMD
jgi:hypothetical protein